MARSGAVSVISAAGIVASQEAAQVNGQATPMFDLIELFFFAYRDFVADADRVLERYRFGRAHHRVLHFVGRNPGLTIARLLVILKITKQSLNRVMKDLTDAGFIEVRHGTQDRRQRHLFLDAPGAALAAELAELQTARFNRALADLGDGARAGAVAFLLATIDPQERAEVLQLVFGERSDAISAALSNGQSPQAT